jgi:arylsulfatase A-like enzyme
LIAGPPPDRRFFVRVAVWSATLGALAAALNWEIAFSTQPYARAYLVVLLGLGALAGAAAAALTLAARIAARRLPTFASVLAIGSLPARARTALRWAWVLVVGAGLTALAGYLGSAPRFAPLLSLEPRGRAVDASQPPNVILFSFDTVRPDHLGAYGASARVSPNFDALAGNGTIFTRCVAASSWTIPSHAAIFTGRAPSHIGGHVVLQSRGGDVSLPKEAITLAEIFRAAGYHTAGFIGGHTLSAAFGFDQGFEVFNDGMPPSISSLADRIFLARPIARWTRAAPRRLLKLVDPILLAVSNYLYSEAHTLPPEVKVAYTRGERRFANRADEVNQKVSAWLDRRPPRPFFLFVHYFDAHDPYDPPAPYAPAGADRSLGFILSNGIAERVLTGRGPLTESERSGLIADYDGEIAFLDHQFGLLMERLKVEGALDNAIVAAVSDHGESFGEHGLVFHGHFLYDDLTRMVFLLQGRGVPAGRREEMPVSGIDVAPTLLDLAGVEPPGTFEGRSLRPLLAGRPMEGRPVFSEIFGRLRNWEAWDVFRRTLFSVEAGGLKLIRDTKGKTELFDLPVDPGEAVNLAAGRPADVARLEALLSDYTSRAAPAPPDSDERLSDDALEGLRGLGYIQK